MKKKDKKIKLALFDIDGTIFRSSLLIEFINGLVEAGIFPEKARKGMEGAHLAWLDRRGNYHDYLMKVVKVHLKYIKGKKWSAVKRVVEKVIATHEDRVYRYTRDFVKSLKEKGYVLVSISGSPVYMVKRFADHMGFDYAFGQILEIKNGSFTGKIANPDFYDKEKVLNAFIGREELEVDWKNSVAVGDTDNDIPMLGMVGRPIAFNPNRTFARFAMKRKWQIIVERKDTIYRIKESDILPYEGMEKTEKNR